MIATRPPGRTTRAISAAACSAGRAKITPKTDTAASKAASSKGSFAASPWTNSPPGTRSRATSSSRGEPSSPVTLAPARSATSAALPVPHATSSTRSPPVSPSAATATSETGASSAAVSSYSPTPHASMAQEASWNPAMMSSEKKRSCTACRLSVGASSEVTESIARTTFMYRTMSGSADRRCLRAADRRST